MASDQGWARLRGAVEYDVLHGVSRLRLALRPPPHPSFIGGIDSEINLNHFMLYVPRSLDPHGASLSDLGRFAFP